MSNSLTILRVVIASPLWQSFDYLPPENMPPQDLQPGMRVYVPFGRREMIGVILEVVSQSDIATHKLKRIKNVIDERPLITKKLLQLYQWASDYYHYPLGEMIMGTLPKFLRQGQSSELEKEFFYQLTKQGQQALQAGLKRAPKQNKLLSLISQPREVNDQQCRLQGFSKSDINNLLKKEYIEEIKKSYNPVEVKIKLIPGLKLNAHQQQAVQTISQTNKFKTFLLAGVTGSGKTEVYFQSMTSLLQAGKQALILVPEIGLTPQTVSRFRERFNVPVAVLHSELTDRERKIAWLQALHGEARIIIGTRSAVFVPLKNPGVIILDEEHDTSFKQQSSFRYSARDLAVMRGHLENIPVVLGTATPSLETLYNVRCDKYQCLSLPERAGTAQVPKIKFIDLRGKQLVGGLSAELIDLMKKHLGNNNQVLLFLNRRGYAPTLLCHHCSWVVLCDRCDARMTLHYQPRRLFCHHCGKNKAPPRICPRCQQADLVPLGLGTERLEQTLKEQFAQYKILRVDRDTVRGKYDMQKILDQVQNNEAQILVGTQMLAKGHHFPNLTLVAIIDADGAMFSADFRAMERMAQLLVQVAGRAGREQHPGEVVLQTHASDHPFLNILIKEGYSKFTDAILNERAVTQLPPYSHLALLRAEGIHEMLPNQFLQEVKRQIINDNAVKVLGPVPALMARKAGHYRAQLLFLSQNRTALKKLLQPQTLLFLTCSLKK